MLWAVKLKIYSKINMSFRIFILIYLFCSLISNAYDRENVLNLALNKVVKRERFVDHCYKDSHGHSIGYGDFHYCGRAIKDLKNQILRKNPTLEHLTSDERLREYVKIDEDVALWLAKSYLRDALSTMEKKRFVNKQVVKYLNDEQIAELLDNYYTRSPKLFYKSDLWNVHIKNIVINNKKKLNWKECHGIVDAFLSQGKNNKGVLARRFDEAKFFTDKACQTLDINFQIDILKKYST